jgi:PAS domain S-box-containing protein
LRQGDSGESVEILEVNRDITSRKRAEEDLRMALSYNRSLIEASLDPLVTIDPRGKITDVNRATEQITGYSREELIGTDFINYFVDSKKAREGYRKVFKEESIRNYELEIKQTDGSIIPVIYNASVYRDEKGKVIGVFAAARDITERKRAEEDLLNKSQALEDLNVALKVLLNHRQNDQREFEETISTNTKDRIMPYIEKLKQTRLDTGQTVLVEIIERSLYDITSPFLKNLTLKYSNFTSKEVEIIGLIKDGKTTKEIAQILHVGKRTVDSHRDSIRRKINTTDKKVNLRAYLLSMANT